MECVAKKYPKVQVTVRVHPLNLQRLDAIGEALFRNRSEMIDRAIEEYVERHADAVPREHPRPPRPPRPHRK